MRRMLTNTIHVSMSTIVLVAVTSGCTTTKVVDERCVYDSRITSTYCYDVTEEEMDWGTTALLGAGIAAGVGLMVLLNSLQVERAREEAERRRRMLERMSEEERREFLRSEAERAEERRRNQEALGRTLEDSINKSISDLEETNEALQEQLEQP